MNLYSCKPSIALLVIVTGFACADTKPLLMNDAPLPELIAALKSEDFSTRMRAVDFIGNRKEGAEAAVPALVEALQDSHMRESALHALKSIGPAASEATPALFTALTAYPDQPATRWIAAHALANIGKAAVGKLEDGSVSKILYERLWCAAALARIEGPGSRHFATLVAALQSPDKNAARVGAEGLTMIGAPSVVVLDEIIAATDSPVAARTDLAILLAQFGKGAKPAIPKLVELLDDSDAMTRKCAAYAISEIGGPDAAPAVDGLIRMLGSEQAFVRDMAAVALASIGDPARTALPKLIDRQQKDEDEHVRAATATALGKIDPRDPKVLDALYAAMRDESGRVRSAAAPPLAEHAPINDETIKLFTEASNDNWKSVSYACETFFARLAPEQRDLIPEKFKGDFRQR
ncbi:MAG: HEAT repeat domain-containing protein [Verrucomicrobiales bacterium]